MRRWVTVLSVWMLALALAPAARAMTVQWTRDAGAAVNGAAAGSDGNTYVAGARRHGITREATLIKYGASGKRLWARSWLPSQQASTEGIAAVVVGDTVYLLGSVHGQCEGGGWFIRAYTSGGTLLHKFVTPGWECSIAQTVFDIAADTEKVVVVGMSHGCCGDPFQDGWVRAFSPTLARMWKAPFEPPAGMGIPAKFFDRATAVAIGGNGGILVGGWAATGPTPRELERKSFGTLIIEKVSATGHVVWSKRPGVAMLGTTSIVSVDEQGGWLWVAAPKGGLGPSFFSTPSAPLAKAWLGRFTDLGHLTFSRTWGTTRALAADPMQVSSDQGKTWVVGTQRDPADNGVDAFVRVFGTGGKLLSAFRLDGGVKYLHGTGVASFGARGVVTGFTSDASGFPSHIGKLWRVTA